MAYATRYGRIGLNEAASLDQHRLADYNEALGELVAEENGPSSLRDR